MAKRRFKRVRRFAARVRSSDIGSLLLGSLGSAFKRPLSIFAIAMAFLLYYSVTSNAKLDDSILGWLNTNYKSNAIVGTLVTQMYSNPQKTVGLSFMFASILSATGGRMFALLGSAATFFVYTTAKLTYTSYLFHAIFLFLTMRFKRASNRIFVVAVWLLAMSVITATAIDLSQQIAGPTTPAVSTPPSPATIPPRTGPTNQPTTRKIPPILGDSLVTTSYGFTFPPAEHAGSTTPGTVDYYVDDATPPTYDPQNPIFDFTNPCGYVGLCLIDDSCYRCSDGSPIY